MNTELNVYKSLILHKRFPKVLLASINANALNADLNTHTSVTASADLSTLSIRLWLAVQQTPAVAEVAISRKWDVNELAYAGQYWDQRRWHYAQIG